MSLGHERACPYTPYATNVKASAPTHDSRSAPMLPVLRLHLSCHPEAPSIMSSRSTATKQPGPCMVGLLNKHFSCCAANLMKALRAQPLTCEWIGLDEGLGSQVKHLPGACQILWPQARTLQQRPADCAVSAAQRRIGKHKGHTGTKKKETQKKHLHTRRQPDAADEGWKWLSRLRGSGVPAGHR